ncbi:hypothetical protein BRETT_003263 [Brettanomyces bruxellensis]|uniref:Chitin biosynthesis protein CHS5 n=1 Tax=Dekkera bruxellensis TaxID=5007 RepID=A0A871RJM2_DEKBR|nr:uncharacterized protein BRETT_003263 [Brettanomyces bruxellensis]QOU23072.1 hypothetical protein BRETT_003263 [Brettanomyces bruxellensis]
MVEVSLTVGKLDASLALLLTKDHHIIEFPTILLPDGISTGSIVKIACERDFEGEEKESKQFDALQKTIYETFGKHEPKEPALKVVNVTQTSCVLEWDPLDLGTSELKALTLYKNGAKLGQIRNATTKKNIKLSGLSIDTNYKFQLRMDTTAGIYRSNLLEITTHKMTDLSGITICLGDIDFTKNSGFTLQDIEDAVSKIGARPISKTVRIDTTHFVCTNPTGVECEKAKSINIPVVRPEWIKACELERRIIGVNKFYLNSENPIWKEKDFWKKQTSEALLESSSQIGDVSNMAEHGKQMDTQENQEEPSTKKDIDAEKEKLPKSGQIKPIGTKNSGDVDLQETHNAEPNGSDTFVADKKVADDKESDASAAIPNSEENTTEDESKKHEIGGKKSKILQEQDDKQKVCEETDHEADHEAGSKLAAPDEPQNEADLPNKLKEKSKVQTNVHESDITSSHTLKSLDNKENVDSNEANINETGTSLSGGLDGIIKESPVVDEKENEPISENKQSEGATEPMKTEKEPSEIAKLTEEGSDLGLKKEDTAVENLDGVLEEPKMESVDDNTDADKSPEASTDEKKNGQVTKTDQVKKQTKKKKKNKNKRGRNNGKR